MRPTGVYHRLLQGADGRFARWDVDREPPAGWRPTGVVGDLDLLAGTLAATARGRDATPRDATARDATARPPGPTGPPLPADVVATVAATDPDRCAVRDDAGALGYADLLAAADQVALQMAGLGVRGEELVALSADDRSTAVVGVLAAWRAGAVPVAAGDRCGRPSRLERDGARWVFSTVPASGTAAPSADGPPAGLRAAAGFRVAGAPAAVVVEHGQLRALLDTVGPRVGPGDRVVHAGPPGTWALTILAALALGGGAELHVRAGSSPDHGVVFAARGTRILQLRPPSDVGVLPALRTPAGWPLAAPAYVLDARLDPVPAGHVGRLHVGGPAVARGFVGRPDLTLQRFLPDPFAGDGTRMVDTARTVRRPARAGAPVEMGPDQPAAVQA